MTAPDVLDPFIVAENSQSLGDRLAETASASLDRVLNPAEVEARHSAGLESHTEEGHHSASCER